MKNSHLELRKYQELILTQAKIKNTIAYLPTGTGKTLIACHLIQDRIEKIRISRENTSPRIITFIAPTKPLLNQQIEYIKTNIPFIKAREFNGASFLEKKNVKNSNNSNDNNNKHIDDWDSEDWKIFLLSYEVFGMTPDIFRNLIEKKLIPLENIDLVILDECHHANNNHPMGRLCDALFASSTTSTSFSSPSMKSSLPHKPLILGMTASPVQAKTKDIEMYITNLEQRLQSQFFYPTEELLEALQLHAKKPRMFLIESSSLIQSMNSVFLKELIEIDKDLEIAQKIEDVYSQGQEHYREFGVKEGDARIYFQNIKSSVCNGGTSIDSLELKRLSEMKDVKEIIHQTIEIIKSCGIYCGLYSLFYSLREREEQAEIKHFYKKAIAQKRKQESFPEALQAILTDFNFTDLFPYLTSSGRGNISVDSLEMKSQEAIEYLKGDSSRMEFLINQPKLAFSCYDRLLQIISKELKQSYPLVLRKIIQKLSSKFPPASSETIDQEDSNDLLETALLYYQEAKLQSGSLHSSIVDQLLMRDYEPILLIVCEELQSQISLAPLVKLFSSSLSPAAGDVVNHNIFSEKLCCLGNLIAIPFPSAPNDLRFRIKEISLKNGNKVEEMNRDGSALLTIMQQCLSDLSVSPSPSTSSKSSGGDSSSEKSEKTGNDGATIVFCNMRLTAIALDYLFTQIAKAMISVEESRLTPPSSPLKTGAIFGSSSSTSQQKTLQSLKDGAINILFATDIAQEGIDVKPCNFILNYDSPNTLIGFIQRRGRARSANSLYIQLVESFNRQDKLHGRATADAFQFIQQEEETNVVLQQLMSVDEKKDAHLLLQKAFVIPSTGASVDAVQAPSLLQQYCSYIISKDIKSNDDNSYMKNYLRYFSNRERLTLLAAKGEFSCTLLLPDYIQQKKFTDCPKEFKVIAANKRLARGLVAIEAIKYLYSKQAFDDHLRYQLPPDVAIVGSASKLAGEESNSNSNASKQMETIFVRQFSLMDGSSASQLIENPLVQDRACKLLYVYALNLHLSPSLEERKDSFTAKYSSQLDALRKIGFVTMSRLSERVSQSLYDLFLPSAENTSGKEDPAQFEIVYLGVRESTMIDLQNIRFLNKVIVGLESLDTVSSSSSSPPPPHAPFTTIDSDSNIYKQVLSAVHQDHHQDGSDSFLILPLPDEVNPNYSSKKKISSQQQSSTSDLFLKDQITSQYLEDCLKESLFLFNNLRILQGNNYSERDCSFFFESHLPSSLSFEQPQQQPPFNPQQVYTSNGRNLICFEGNSFFNQKKFTDRMDERKPKTFLDHFRKKNPFVGEFLQKFQKDHPDFLLQRGYTLSGKLTYCDLLRDLRTLSVKESEEEMQGGMKRDASSSSSSSSSSSEVDLFLPLCCPIGSLFYYHLIFLLPSLHYRIHSILLADELYSQRLEMDRGRLSIVPKLKLPDLLAAITPRRSLHSFNSERLEFLGDVFLKYATTIWCFFEQYDADESTLTNKRMKLLSNKYLTTRAIEQQISQYLRVLKIHHHIPDEVLLSLPHHHHHHHHAGDAAVGTALIKWLPSLRNQNLTLSADQIRNYKHQKGIVSSEESKEDEEGNVDENEDTRMWIEDDEKSTNRSLVKVKISGKAIADMMEAILGASIVGEDQESIGFYVMNKLTILTDLSNIPKELCDPCLSSTLSSQQSIQSYVNHVKTSFDSNSLISQRTLRDAECRINYSFTHKELLNLALLHPSKNHCWNYERFEYLGDAVLDYLVAKYLFSLRSDWQEGNLSKWKSIFTSNYTLGQICRSLQLYQYLQHTSLQLSMDSSTLLLKSDESIISFGNNQEDCYLFEMKEIIENTIRKKEEEKITKVLADQFEALIGAMYLDKGGQLSEVKKWLNEIGYFNISLEELESLQLMFAS